MNYNKEVDTFIEIMKKINKQNNLLIENNFNGQDFILDYLHSERREITSKEISEIMGISSARVSVIIRRMEEKNLIIRNDDKKDRRKALIKLTEYGESEANQLEQQRLDYISDLFDYVGKEDTKSYLRILKKFSEYKAKNIE